MEVARTESPPLKDRGIHDFGLIYLPKLLEYSTKQIDELKSALEEDTGKIAVLVGMGGQAQTASTPRGCGGRDARVDGGLLLPARRVHSGSAR